MRLHNTVYFRLVSQYSLTLSLDHLFTQMCDTTKRLPSDKAKEHCEINLKVHSVMQLHTVINDGISRT